MSYDYFRVTGAHDTVLDYADLFSVTLHDDNIQEFDTRWDEVLLSMTKISSEDVLESLYKLRIRQSDQLKTALELYDIEIHQKISMPNYQKLKTMVKRSIDQKLRLRNFDASKQVQWLRVTGDQVALEEEQEFALSGKQIVSVREETNAVSDTRVMIVQNRHQKPLHPLRPPTPRGRSASRKKEPQRQEPVWEVQPTAVQKLLERYLH